MNKYLIMPVLTCMLITGCTVNGGGISKKDANKSMICTDTRNSKTFKFNTNTVTNVRRGIGAPNSFDIITDKGNKMTLNSDMEAWLLCEEFETKTGE